MMFWVARILMTIWLFAIIAFGLFGTSISILLWMIPLGTIMYQGFKPIEPPLMTEATLRILFYSLVGIALVSVIFFFLGRIGFWIFG